MAPRRTNARALKPVENVQNPMTPRREVTALKTKIEAVDQENESLRSQMDSLTAELQKFKLDNSENQAPNATTIAAPVVPTPDFSHISAPPLPARPQTAYIRFTSEARAKAREDNPSASLPEITKILADTWKSMSDEDKKPYTDKYEEDKVVHEAQMKKYRAAMEKVDMEKAALMKMYEAKKTEVALQFYEQAVATNPAPAQASPMEVDNGVEAPKKPLSAYQIFCAHTRAKMAEASPSEKIAPSEMMKELSQQWLTLKKSKAKASAKKIAQFEKQAEQDKERYESEMKVYRERVAEAKELRATETQKRLEQERKIALKTYAPVIQAELAAKEQKRLEMQEKREKKLRKEDEPKRPRTSYIFFCKEERPAVVEALAGAPQTAIMEELGRRWKQLDDGQKSKFNDMAQSDKERYEREMKEFKASS